MVVYIEQIGENKMTRYYIDGIERSRVEYCDAVVHSIIGGYAIRVEYINGITHKYFTTIEPE